MGSAGSGSARVEGIRHTVKFESAIVHTTGLPHLHRRRGTLAPAAARGIRVPLALSEEIWSLLPLLDEVCDALAYHQDSDVDVGPHTFGHDRGVRDAQSLRSVEFAVLIHHSHGI